MEGLNLFNSTVFKTGLHLAIGLLYKMSITEIANKTTVSAIPSTTESPKQTFVRKLILDALKLDTTNFKNIIGDNVDKTDVVFEKLAPTLKKTLFTSEKLIQLWDLQKNIDFHQETINEFEHNIFENVASMYIEYLRTYSKELLEKYNAEFITLFSRIENDYPHKKKL
jgi:hypothetical protein